jgi:hypothetical protein
MQRPLRALAAQRADIEAVILYLPRRYSRLNVDLGALPDVPEGITIRVIDEDFGPATKILPALREFRGQDVNLIFGDDDHIYDPDWAGRLLASAEAHPGCAIAEEGGDVRHYSSYEWSGPLQPRARRLKKNLRYRLRRIASLGRWRPRRNGFPGYVDLIEGFGGVLVRPEFFTGAVFDIPKLLWMVDDIWLSGQLAANGVPIWLNVVEHYRPERTDWGVLSTALHKQTFEGMGRNAHNQAAIDWFRERYGIWGGSGLAAASRGVA